MGRVERSIEIVTDRAKKLGYKDPIINLRCGGALNRGMHSYLLLRDSRNWPNGLYRQISYKDFMKLTPEPPEPPVLNQSGTIPPLKKDKNFGWFYIGEINAEEIKTKEGKKMNVYRIGQAIIDREEIIDVKEVQTYRGMSKTDAAFRYMKEHKLENADKLVYLKDFDEWRELD